MEIFDGHVHFDCGSNASRHTPADLLESMGRYEEMRRSRGITGRAVAIVYPEQVGLYTEKMIEGVRDWSFRSYWESVLPACREYPPLEGEITRRFLQNPCYSKLLRMTGPSSLYVSMHEAADRVTEEVLERAKGLGFIGVKEHFDGYGFRRARIFDIATRLGMPCHQVHFDREMLDRINEHGAETLYAFSGVIKRGGRIYFAHAGNPLVLSRVLGSGSAVERFLREHKESVWLGTSSDLGDENGAFPAGALDGRYESLLGEGFQIAWESDYYNWDDFSPGRAAAGTEEDPFAQPAAYRGGNWRQLFLENGERFASPVCR